VPGAFCPPGQCVVHRRALLLATPGLVLARAAAAADTVLRVGDQKGGTQSVMKAAAGLDGLPYRLEWSQFPAAAPLLEALNAGAVDAAFAGDAPATFALAAGLRGKIILPTHTSGAGTAVMVPTNSPIRSVADLKGRRIAANRGSIAHALVLALAEQQGWSAGDYTLANLLPAEAKTALSEGAVDAWCSWGVYVAQARLQEEARIVVDGGNGLLTGLSYMVASDDAIAARRGALLDFCRRLVRARRWVKAHPDEYARVLAAEIGVAEPVARLAFESEIPVPVPIDDRVVADEQRTADRYLRARVIRERLDAGQVFDRSFNEALAA
jgi:sulfonate transport system substrate-binding protein